MQAGDKFYLFGGRENARTLDTYDYASDIWTRSASAPIPFNYLLSPHSRLFRTDRAMCCRSLFVIARFHSCVQLVARTCEGTARPVSYGSRNDF